MTPTAIRKAALYAGLFYIATFVFSIPALPLYDAVTGDPSWVLGSGGDTPVLWGALIEVITALTCIGSAAALYPVLRRYGPGRAVGFVAARTLEAAVIVAGVVTVLAIVTLRQQHLPGVDTAAITTTASALVALKDWTFLAGPGILPAVNALLFASILYQTRLVPRWMPTLGLIGAPILLASSTAILFGAWEPVSTMAIVMALPIAVWEFSIGTYMVVKGFRTPTVPSGDPTDDPVVVTGRPSTLTHA